MTDKGSAYGRLGASFVVAVASDTIYFEARSASPSDVAVGAAARLNAVYESLDKLDTSFATGRAASMSARSN